MVLAGLQSDGIKDLVQKIQNLAEENKKLHGAVYEFAFLNNLMPAISSITHRQSRENLYITEERPGYLLPGGYHNNGAGQ